METATLHDRHGRRDMQQFRWPDSQARNGIRRGIDRRAVARAALRLDVLTVLLDVLIQVPEHARRRRPSGSCVSRVSTRQA